MYRVMYNDAAQYVSRRNDIYYYLRIGVEIGQLLIVLPVFLVLKAMKLSAPTFRRGFQLPVSAVISVTGLFWVAERTGLIGIF